MQHDPRWYPDAKQDRLKMQNYAAFSLKEQATTSPQSRLLPPNEVLSDAPRGLNLIKQTHLCSASL